MQKSYKGRGVVLNTLKYGDTSVVVQMLTDVGGRQSFMVQGVRGKSAKMALFQPLFGVEFEGLRSSRSDMHRFREVHSGVVLERTPFDVRRSTIALFMAEVIYRLVSEREENHELFDFVWGSLIALDTIEEGVSNFHLWFLANLSRQLGFYPGNEHTDGAWFDIVEGCFVSSQPQHRLYLDPENSEFLRDFVECDIRHLGEIGMNRTQRVSLLEGLLIYYGYHLDGIGTIKSIEVLREVF